MQHDVCVLFILVFQSKSINFFNEQAFLNAIPFLAIKTTVFVFHCNKLIEISNRNKKIRVAPFEISRKFSVQPSINVEFRM